MKVQGIYIFMFWDMANSAKLTMIASSVEESKTKSVATRTNYKNLSFPLKVRVDLQPRDGIRADIDKSYAMVTDQYDGTRGRLDVLRVEDDNNGDIRIADIFRNGATQIDTLREEFVANNRNITTSAGFLAGIREVDDNTLSQLDMARLDHDQPEAGYYTFIV